MATLKYNIGATDPIILVAAPDDATKGLRFRIDDELIDLAGFDRYVIRGGIVRPGVDTTRWVVNRGVGDSVKASHSAGATIKAAISASVSGDTLTPPDPFPDAGGSAFPLTADVSADGFTIGDLADPVADGDAVPKSYVDGVGGLPDGWTQDAEGTVTAIAPSDDLSTLVLTAPDDENPGTGGYALKIIPKSDNWNGGIFWSIGDQSLLSGNAYLMRAINEVTARQVFDIDSWGSMSLSADVDGGGGLDLKAGDDQNVLNVVMGVDLADSRMEIRGRLRVITDFIIDWTTPVADADLNPGDVSIYFDQTNGAAKLKIKGKSANGTVVTGEVALT